MSIVNDALKKAGKEFEFNSQDAQITLAKKPVSDSDKKWTAMITIALVIVVSLFGSLILYKNMAKLNSDYAAAGSKKPVSIIQAALNNIEQKNPIKAMKSYDLVKLNGIVYGSEGKWAIVNNRIVKEGDSLLGGEVVDIAKDFVRIQKDDGSEIVLSLK